ARGVALIVREVFPGTPAAAAGFEVGDRLIQIHTRKVAGLADVLDPMFLHRSGDRVDFRVLRRGEQIPVSLVVGSRPTSSPALPETAPTLVDVPRVRPGPLLLVPASAE
ncbi:MAG: PDZ domain-containing protein, partial [Desulfuromonadales bacterium]|nr:PDZ domain-containing protein [Desulfuromonadales bacterium]NIS40761.1 PDZ domain-containing protein [Desulfuromonadales bacterium]